LRQVTWPEIGKHHGFITGQMKAGVTVKAIHLRLADEHRLAASYASLRRYVAANVPEEVRREQVRVLRLAPRVPGEEAQIDYGQLGRWADPATGARHVIWAFVMVLCCSRQMFVRPVIRLDQHAWTECHVAAFDVLEKGTLAPLPAGGFEDEISRRSGAACAGPASTSNPPSRASTSPPAPASPPPPSATSLPCAGWPPGNRSLVRPGRRRQDLHRLRPGPQAIRAGHEVRFAKTSRILADLAGGRADSTWDKRLRAWARPAVLVCDDFGLRELTPAQADDLYELITERAGKPVIITSNRAPADWYPLFPNPVVAESLLDRLINTSHQIVMDGPSYRPNKRPGAPQRAIPPGKETIV
jgi:hypothetical protein